MKKIGNAALIVLFLVLSSLAAAGGYRLLKRISIPGDYGWDYVTADSEGRRLYVSHDKEVVALDLDSGAMAGKIPGNDVHGIAIVRELGRGFISATDPGSSARPWSAKTPTRFFTTTKPSGSSP
jgi:hypothetical protein